MRFVSSSSIMCKDTCEAFGILPHLGLVKISKSSMLVISGVNDFFGRPLTAGLSMVVQSQVGLATVLECSIQFPRQTGTVVCLNR